MKKAESMLGENNKSCLTFYCCNFLEWRIKCTTFLPCEIQSGIWNSYPLFMYRLIRDTCVRTGTCICLCMIKTFTSNQWTQNVLKLNYSFTKDSEWVWQSEINQACLLFLVFPRQLKDLSDADGQHLG